MARARNEEIDLLRGYSILFVMFHHVVAPFAQQSDVLRWVTRHASMSVGVDIFFAISGFVIARSLRDFWQTQSGPGASLGAIGVFWRRRFWRLWPASMVWLSLCLAGCLIFEGQFSWPPIDQMIVKWQLGSVYAYNFHEAISPSLFGYFWSLSVEWQFYMLLPVFLIVIRNAMLRSGILSGLLLMGAVWRPGGPEWWYFHCDGILVGVLLCQFLDHSSLGPVRRPATVRPWVAAAFTVALLSLVVTLPALVERAHLAWVLLSMCSGLLVLAASFGRGYVSDLGLGRLIGWLGSRSYALYLCHIPVALVVYTLRSAWLDGLEAVLGTRPAELPAYVIACALLIGAAGELTYRLVEVPSLAWSRRAADRWLPWTRQARLAPA